MRSRSRSPDRDGGAKRARTINLFDEHEDAVEAVGSAFELAAVLDALDPVVTDTSLPRERRHILFTALVEKAIVYFCPDIVLEVMAFVDRYYLTIKNRFMPLDRCVHDYTTKVINQPTPPGIKQLIKRVIADKRDRYDTVFNRVGKADLGHPETWVTHTPTVKEEAAKLVQWIDSKCSDIDLKGATARIKKLFVESREEELKVGEEGYDETQALTQSMRIDLNCPLSTTRIVIPACGKAVKTLQPFDLEHFLTVNIERSRTMLVEGKQHVWRCPISNTPLDEHSILIDPFFADILSKVPPHTRYVIVNKDGTWEEEPSPEAADDTAVYTTVEDGPPDPRFEVIVKAEPQGS